MVGAGRIYTVLVGYHLPKLCDAEKERKERKRGKENKQEGELLGKEGKERDDGKI